MEEYLIDQVFLNDAESQAGWIFRKETLSIIFGHAQAYFSLVTSASVDHRRSSFPQIDLSNRTWYRLILLDSNVSGDL